MKLVDALKIVQQTSPGDSAPLNVALVCGCSPLHLKTFLAAHLQILFPDRRVDVQTGLYGDTLGSLERLSKAPLDGAAVLLEWSDLDPRLGIRHLGGWGPKDLGYWEVQIGRAGSYEITLRFAGLLAAGVTPAAREVTRGPRMKTAQSATVFIRGPRVTSSRATRGTADMRLRSASLCVPA